MIERAKEEIGAMLHQTDESDHHHKETHGLRKDIDDKTPLEEVKAPNVFERMKEEFEAVVEAIHPKKESDPTLEIKTQEKADSKSGMTMLLILDGFLVPLIAQALLFLVMELVKNIMHVLDLLCHQYKLHFKQCHLQDLKSKCVFISP